MEGFEVMALLYFNHNMFTVDPSKISHLETCPSNWSINTCKLNYKEIDLDSNTYHICHKRL